MWGNVVAFGSIVYAFGSLGLGCTLGPWLARQDRGHDMDGIHAMVCEHGNPQPPEASHGTHHRPHRSR